MRVDGNAGGKPNYEPDSAGTWQESTYREPPLALDGKAADHWNHRVDEDYYSQAGNVFRLFTVDEKQRLFDTIAGAIESVDTHIIERQLQHFKAVDPDYEKGVRTALAAR